MGGSPRPKQGLIGASARSISFQRSLVSLMVARIGLFDYSFHGCFGASSCHFEKIKCNYIPGYFNAGAHLVANFGETCIKEDVFNESIIFLKNKIK